MDKLPTLTATQQNSIFAELGQEQFYDKIQKTKAKYKDQLRGEATYTHSDWKRRGNHNGSRSLQFHDERFLADDLAFISSPGAGHIFQNGKYITATIIEEDVKAKALRIRAATNDGIKEPVRELLESILRQFEMIAAKPSDREACTKIMFTQVVTSHQKRILTRLHPPSTTPLIDKFRNAIDSIHSQNPDYFENLKTRTQELSDNYDMHRAQLLSRDESDKRKIEIISMIINQAYEISIMLSRRTLESSLSEILDDSSDQVRKSVRKLDKLARYRRVCIEFGSFAAENTSRFKKFSFIPMAAYTSCKLSGEKRHVHAEIQLVTYMELHPSYPRPRIIGCNKASCFLCDAFITAHKQYYVSATHGKLYHQWAIPDLEAYSNATRMRFKNTLGSILGMLQNLLLVELDPQVPRNIGMESFVVDPSMESLRCGVPEDLPDLAALQEHLPIVNDDIIRGPNQGNLYLVPRNSRQSLRSSSVHVMGRKTPKPPEFDQSGPNDKVKEVSMGRNASINHDTNQLNGHSEATSSSTLVLHPNTIPDLHMQISPNRSRRVHSETVNLDIEHEGPSPLMDKGSSKTSVHIRQIDQEAQANMKTDSAHHTIVDYRDLPVGKDVTFPLLEGSSRKVLICVGRSKDNLFVELSRAD
ncbi:MAG: hypothetical protein M1834_006064 [Cirrosporium novae-zelandiae]|nr:MAG: hypothetical protein M1834_006064 [Cirrosporium novae-zelandiae]